MEFVEQQTLMSKNFSIYSQLQELDETTRHCYRFLKRQTSFEGIDKYSHEVLLSLQNVSEVLSDTLYFTSLTVCTMQRFMKHLQAISLKAE
jgi:hypothetical protein